MLSFNSFGFQLVSLFLFWLIIANFLNLLPILSFFGSFALLLWISCMSANFVAKFIAKEFVSTKGKAVLITGCDTGFGHSAAKALHKSGFKVMATCLDCQSAGARALTALNIKTIELNVTNNDQIQKAKISVDEYLKQTDCKLWALINNAGVFGVGLLEWGDLTDLKRMIDVNVIGLVKVTRCFLPLIRQSQGRVVNVASVAGRVTLPGLAWYSMSKHAIISFSDALRREMQIWSVKVITIEPMAYRTLLADPHVLTCALEDTWDRTPQDIQSDYGANYFHVFKGRYVLRNANRVEKNFQEVIDSMVDSVSNCRPKIAYKCRSKVFAIFTWILETLPNEVTDILFFIYTLFDVKPRALDPE